jgi:hypothetical protein
LGLTRVDVQNFTGVVVSLIEVNAVCDETETVFRFSSGGLSIRRHWAVLTAASSHENQTVEIRAARLACHAEACKPRAEPYAVRNNWHSH